MTERLLEIDPDASIKCYGQEINEETFAIAKADMLIKGGNAENMKHGDTLSASSQSFSSKYPRISLGPLPASPANRGEPF